MLKDGLKRNFREVSVNVVDCPDLTSSPWRLAAPGNNNTLSHTHTTTLHTASATLYALTSCLDKVMVVGPQSTFSLAELANQPTNQPGDYLEMFTLLIISLTMC